MIHALQPCLAFINKAMPSVVDLGPFNLLDEGYSVLLLRDVSSAVRDVR